MSKLEVKETCPFEAARGRLPVLACVGIGLWSLAFMIAVAGVEVADTAAGRTRYFDMSATLVAGGVMTVLGMTLAWVLTNRWLTSAGRADPRTSRLAALEGRANPVEPSASWRTLVKDPLTGLFSRNALLAFADDAIPYFRRYKRGVSILMVEIDAFATIAETHGPAGSDQALRHVADVLDLSVRKTDKVARFDHDRFIVLLREISAADTQALASRIREAVSDLGVRHGGVVIPVTVSMGAALVSETDLISETLIERAEAALGVSKAAGGNRVTFRSATAAGLLENAA